MTKAQEYALRATLLFHSGKPWDDRAKIEWKRLTGSDEATTVSLCDAVRMSLGLLPHCFGDLKGFPVSRLPSDFPLSGEQRDALKRISEGD